MGAMMSQITGVLIVFSTVCSGADQRKHQSSAPLAFVRGIHRRTQRASNAENDDVIMSKQSAVVLSTETESDRSHPHTW